MKVQLPLSVCPRFLGKICDIFVVCTSYIFTKQMIAECKQKGYGKLAQAWRENMNQKLEDILNLALETPETTREQTDTLNVGFDSESRTWELIVKYHGSLDRLEKLSVRVEYLIAGYAILTVPEELVDLVAELEEIEYVEKPKRYFYSVTAPAESACLPQVTMSDPYLTGRGVLIAILDSGECVIIMSSQ